VHDSTALDALVRRAARSLSLPFERKRYYPGLLAADPMLDTAAVAAYNPRKFVEV